jgi:hypothetical protein
MDKNTLMALLEIVAYAEVHHPDEHPDAHYKAFKLMEAWIAKQIRT